MQTVWENDFRWDKAEINEIFERQENSDWRTAKEYGWALKRDRLKCGLVS